MLVAAIALLLVAIVVVECTRVIAGFRRAVRLNRALHELRRPLQAISLAVEGRSPDLRCAGACLDQARRALEDLDAAINRRAVAPRPVRTALEEIATALEDRWSLAAVRVSATDAPVAIEADPVRVGAALDNLVSNAIDHGSGPVTVRALAGAGTIHFEVRDAGPAGEAGVDAERVERDSRHGHGLRIAAEHAASQGGSLLAPRPTPGRETIAALSLPLDAPAGGPGPG